MELFQHLFTGEFESAQNFFVDNFALALVFFVIGLLLIMIGGDRFVDASIVISKRMGIPEIIVGATIVSLGTTLPEILVSTTAAISGQGDMAVGNAFGSIVCNTALIAGVTQLCKPSKGVERSSISWRSILYFTVYIVVSAIGLYTGRGEGGVGYISRTIGIILLLCFCLYAYLSIKMPGSEEGEEEEEKNEGSLVVSLVTLVVCAALLFVGSKFLVNCGGGIAKKVHVPEAVISVTFIALGTSLPELVTAISSLIKGHANVSLGNIIGANTLNLLLVTGIPAAIGGIHIKEMDSFRMTAPVGLGVMLLLVVPFLVKKRGYRIQGALLICCYAAYSVAQFMMS